MLGYHNIQKAACACKDTRWRTAAMTAFTVVSQNEAGIIEGGDYCWATSTAVPLAD